MTSQKIEFQKIEFETPTFETFFEYFAIIVKSGTDQGEILADNWLIENHLGIDINKATMRQMMNVTKRLKAYKEAAPLVSELTEFDYDGHSFEFHDQPASLFNTIKREVKADPNKGFLRAIKTCYTCDGKPIHDVKDELNFNHAGVLVANFSSFF